MSDDAVPPGRRETRPSDEPPGDASPASPGDPHPGVAFEALPDDAARPTEVTIRPRYADATTATWVSARIEDTVSLRDSR